MGYSIGLRIMTIECVQGGDGVSEEADDRQGVVRHWKFDARKSSYC